MPQKDTNRIKKIGKKANNLIKLERYGFNVPRFIVVSEETLKGISDDEHLYNHLYNGFLHKYGTKIPDLVSVRSSGSVSTPGRMKTLLKVKTDKDSLIGAFKEVVESTKSTKLKKYLKAKEVKNFSYSVIIQEMVLGDFSEQSLSGVLITTNPYTDVNEYYAELVFNSTGDRLMDGKVNPKMLDELETIHPIAKLKLDTLVWEIKKLFNEHQEVEFVVEGSDLFVLQTRDYRLSNKRLYNQLSDTELIGGGKPIIPVTAVGEVTFDKKQGDLGKILVTHTTDFEDTEDILEFSGIITRTGGRLCHAAIIANDFDLPCIVGAQFKEEPKTGMPVMFDEKGSIFKITPKTK